MKKSHSYTINLLASRPVAPDIFYCVHGVTVDRVRGAPVGTVGLANGGGVLHALRPRTRSAFRIWGHPDKYKHGSVLIELASKARINFYGWTTNSKSEFVSGINLFRTLCHSASDRCGGILLTLKFDHLARSIEL